MVERIESNSYPNNFEKGNFNGVGESGDVGDSGEVDAPKTNGINLNGVFIQNFEFTDLKELLNNDEIKSYISALPKPKKDALDEMTDVALSMFTMFASVDALENIKKGMQTKMKGSSKSMSDLKTIYSQQKVKMEETKKGLSIASTVLTCVSGAFTTLLSGGGIFLSGAALLATIVMTPIGLVGGAIVGIFGGAVVGTILFWWCPVVIPFFALAGLLIGCTVPVFMAAGGIALFSAGFLASCAGFLVGIANIVCPFVLQGDSKALMITSFALSGASLGLGLVAGTCNLVATIIMAPILLCAIVATWTLGVGEVILVGALMSLLTAVVQILAGLLQMVTGAFSLTSGIYSAALSGVKLGYACEERKIGQRQIEIKELETTFNVVCDIVKKIIDKIKKIEDNVNEVARNFKETNSNITAKIA